MIERTISGAEAPLPPHPDIPAPPSIGFNGLHSTLRAFSDQDWRVPMVFADVETTGLSPDCDRIVEIGGVRYDENGEYAGSFHCYTDPGVPIPDEAAAVHGITDARMREMLDSGQAVPLSREVMRAFSRFCNNAVFVAHNGTVFDRIFIDRECRRHRIPTITDRAGGLDTLHIARMRWPGSRVSLDDLCSKTGIDKSARANAHGALLDSVLLASIFPRMMACEDRTLLSHVIGVDDVSEIVSVTGRLGELRSPDRLLWAATPEEIARSGSIDQEVCAKWK